MADYLAVSRYWGQQHRHAPTPTDEVEQLKGLKYEVFTELAHGCESLLKDWPEKIGQRTFFDRSEDRSRSSQANDIIGHLLERSGYLEYLGCTPYAARLCESHTLKVFDVLLGPDSMKRYVALAGRLHDLMRACDVSNGPHIITLKGQVANLRSFLLENRG